MKKPEIDLTEPEIDFSELEIDFTELEQEVIDAVDDGLIKFIADKTVDLIQSVEKRIIKKEYEAFSQFNDYMNVVNNTVELIYNCNNSLAKGVPIDVVRIIVALTDLKHAVKNCAYIRKNDKDNYFDTLETLTNLVNALKLGHYFGRNEHFTLEDISKYKEEFEKEEKYRYRPKPNLVEEAEKKEENKKIDEWLIDNAVKDFDFSVLSEDECRILKFMAEKEIKTLSISYVQRKFDMGYPRAAKIVDHLEELGVVSTKEEASSLGIKGRRIIKVTYNLA